MKLVKNYSLINSGDKIKYVYLETPNHINADVVSFPDGILPEEFGLDKYIDREHQFNSSFVEPFDLILKAIGVNIDRTFGSVFSLESFAAEISITEPEPVISKQSYEVQVMKQLDAFSLEEFVA
jgi:hypothetical protein